MRRPPALAALFALVAAATGTQAASAAGGVPQPAALARPPAEAPAGIDVGSVIETVRHYIPPSENGLLRVEDPLYRADLGPHGFALTLRGTAPGARGYRGAAQAIPFADAPAFSVEVASAGGVAVTPGRWVPDYNHAERPLAPGIIERLTAKEGSVEWDLVLERPPPGGELRVEAVVTGPRSPPQRAGNALRWPADGGRGVRMGEMVVVDASGRVIHRALPGAAPGSATLAVPASALRGARYPVTVDPVVSPEYSSSDPVVTPRAGHSQDAPAVAFGQSSFMVVWHDYRSGVENDVYGARVTPSGTVLDETGIPISTAPGDQFFPELAWNGGDFLVAWEDTRNGTSDVYGARVSAAGAVKDPAGIALSTAAGLQLSPALAWDGNNFLVAWDDRRSGTSDVYGTRVSGAGSVLEPGGIAISTAVGAQREPEVASSGQSFFVVWGDDRSSTTTSRDIYGARVTSAGVVADPAGVAISTAAGPQQRPSLAWGGSHFLVAWEDGRTGTFDVYAARVSSSGSVVEAAGFAVSAAANLQLRASVARSDTGWMVVWDDQRSGTTSDIYGARVSAAGVVQEAAGIAISTEPGDQVSPSVDWSGTGFLVAWRDADPHPSIDGGRVSPAGAVLQTNIPISTAANGQFFHDVAWGGGNYLVVWDDNRFDLEVYAARVSPGGVVLDASGILVAGGAGSQGLPTVAWNGASFLVAWAHLDDAQTDYDVRAARVSPAGIVLGSPIALSSVPGFQVWPSVALNGSRFLVAWEQQGAAFDLHGARVSADGGLLDSPPIVISGAANQQVSPDVAWGGGSYLVAWSDARSGTSFDVYAARVGSDGVLQDPGGIPVSTAADHQLAPDVASDGTGFMVAWQDQRSGTSYDIYGARVNAGVVQEPAGIAISTGPAQAYEPAAAWMGTSYVVAWQDRRSGIDVYAARVDASGVVRDPAGIAVAATGDQEYLPHAVRGPLGRVVISYTRFAPGPPYGATRVFLRFFDDPANDAFTDAQAVSGVSGAADGVNSGTTKQPGEPDHAGNAGGRSVWYRWTAPATGDVEITTVKSVFDTLLGVYTGGAVDALSTVASDDDGGGAGTSRVTFYALLGTTYRIAVDGKDAATGALFLAWNQVPDTVAPDTTITGGPSGPVNSTTAVFTFTATEPATFQCALDDEIFSACTSPKSYSSLAEGQHTFKCRAVDRAANTDASPATRTFTVDTTPPPPPTVSVPAPGASINSTSVTFSGTAEPLATVRILEGLAVRATGTADLAGAWSATGTFTEGSHTVTVTATDQAGNTGGVAAALDFTVDLTAPAPPVITTPSTDAAINSLSVTVSGTAEAGATVKVYDGATLRATVAASGAGAWSVSRTFTEGPHTLTATATDVAGNTGDPSAPRSFTVDVTDPDTVIDTGPSGIVNSGNAAFTFSSTEPAGATFECALDSESFAACASPKAYTGLPDGLHTFQVRAKDRAGNTDATPATRTWTVDAPPDTRIISGPPPFTSSRSARFEFESNQVDSTFRCTLDGSAATCSSPKIYTSLPEGPHTFEVRATDSSGLTDPSPATWDWFIDTSPPVVAMAHPGPGVYENGETVVPGGVVIVLIGPMTFRADATDQGSDVVKVCFAVDDSTSETCVDTRDPGTGQYHFTYTPELGVPRHTIHARAHNGAGLISTASVQVLALPRAR